MGYKDDRYHIIYIHIHIYIYNIYIYMVIRLGFKDTLNIFSDVAFGLKV